MVLGRRKKTPEPDFKDLKRRMRKSDSFSREFVKRSIARRKEKVEGEIRALEEELRDLDASSPRPLSREERGRLEAICEELDWSRKDIRGMVHEMSEKGSSRPPAAHGGTKRKRTEQSSWMRSKGDKQKGVSKLKSNLTSFLDGLL